MLPKGASQELIDHYGAIFEKAAKDPEVIAQMEAKGTQVVYLDTYMGCEPTLMTVITLALEALGGRPLYPVDEEDRLEYGRPTTAAEIEERRKELHGAIRQALAKEAVLLPVTAPFHLLGCFKSLLLMPWRIWKAWRSL
jgi:hypothetical protein